MKRETYCESDSMKWVRDWLKDPIVISKNELFLEWIGIFEGIENFGMSL